MFSRLRNRFEVPEAGGRDGRFVCGLISVLALAALVLPASAAADPLGSVTEFTTSPPPGTSLGAIAPGADGNLWVAGRARIGRITPSGELTTFSGLQPGEESLVFDIAPGPDGNLWFADSGNFGVGLAAIGRVTTAGSITEFSNGLVGGPHRSIAPGPDGNLWFTSDAGNEIQRLRFPGFVDGDTFKLTFNGEETAAITFNSAAATLRPAIDSALEALPSVGSENILVQGNLATGGIKVSFVGTLALTDEPQMACQKVSGAGTCSVETVQSGSPASIGRITTAGAITAFSAGLNAGAAPTAIAPGPDGNLWFVDEGTTKAIGRITPTGTIAEFSAGLNEGAKPISIAPGPDGNLWFTDQGTTKAIGRITTAGTVTEFSAGLNAGAAPTPIAPGPDGNLWAADNNSSKVLRFGLGAPPASLRAPSVLGSLQEQTQLTCGDDQWSNWAGSQPFDGGLLASSTTPPAVEWTLNGNPVATTRTYTPGAGTSGQTISCRENVTYRYPLEVTVPVASQPATLIEQSQGEKGDKGDTGATGKQGEPGVNGTNGTNGANGAPGPKGDQGAQGPPGRDAKVTCTVKKKAKGVKVTCKVQLVASASSSRVRWKLTHGGRVYARGSAKAQGRSVSLSLGSLPSGRYHLRLRGQARPTAIVVS